MISQLYVTTNEALINIESKCKSKVFSSVTGFPEIIVLVVTGKYL